MRKVTNIVVILLIVVVLIGGGVMGYLWYSTKQQVDQMIADAKPFADISYGSIIVLPTGSVGVSQLRIRPTVSGQTVSIGAVRLNAPNLLALFNMGRQVKQGRLPEDVSLVIEEVELPFEMLGAASEPTAPHSAFDNLQALACGPVSQFGVTELQEMGYDRLISSMKMGYRLDPRQNHLDLRLDGNTRDWMSINLDMSFSMPVLPATPMDFILLTPRLAKLDLVIRDNGFNQRRNEYCAKKAGKPVNDYLADHVQLLVERLRANGFNPGPGIIAAYQASLIDGGELAIVATPPTAINPAELPDYAAADAIKLLGLTLKANNTAINDLTVDWDTAKLSKAMGFAPEPAPEEAAPVVVAPKPVMIPPKEYHSTSVSDLNRYIGKIAKLKTTTGAEYRGQLDGITEGMLRITVRKSGGSVTLSLRVGEITAAEVLY
ncbi:MAG: hypothetical protein HC889_11070 [Synechococcaceae cyanobacterium SM1_2_3]|nr:hypothetical protein [Synechococcaceae cyanobacterium SM1_2_3]